VRDVFLVINGSGTRSNAFVHPTFGALVRTHPVAYMTYDKPGIGAPFGDPAAVHRQDDLVQRYTLGHGVACATGAVRWAREKFGRLVRVHLRAHSEGTLIALYVYDALLERDAEAAGSIATLVLSGLAVEPLAKILDQQLAVLPAGAQIREALAACDWNQLRAYLGFSCAYLEDANRRPSGRQMFERLAARKPAARFYVFHGTEDWNTPVDPVRALQAWNSTAGHLPIEFHYYAGGHRGSDSARAELVRLLNELVTR
jgi:hypothetical protein